jgi:hypothetical protein
MAGPKPRNRDGWEDCQGPGAFHVEILGSNQGLSWRACGARPSRGGLSKLERFCGEIREMTPGCGFIGGTHSVRPRCEAVPMPRHNMIIGGKRTPGGLMGRSSDPSKVPLPGVRSPPLRGVGYPSQNGLAGKARRWRRRRFSRRDALCASALRGRAYAEA